MLKGLLVFALTRRPIILVCVLVFVAVGAFAFTRLNIEAYPNPAPVILEITAQASGLSAEEMERYYTIPMEVGLAATPGVDIIRSTSFYGLSFVRVTFKYGVDYYFALTQAAISLQQNVSLPNGVTPQIQGSSLVGEVYRYQLVGPPHFGLTNLRTVQDWIVQRRLLTVEGVVQVNTWGGTTKEFNVDIDLNKLDAYGVTLPQVLAAIGNANSMSAVARSTSDSSPLTCAALASSMTAAAPISPTAIGFTTLKTSCWANSTASRCKLRTSARSTSAMCRGWARPVATIRATSSRRSSS